MGGFHLVGCNSLGRSLTVKKGIKDGKTHGFADLFIVLKACSAG